MVDFKEIMEYVVKTNNPLVFAVWTYHSKKLYKFDEDKGWYADFTEEKIIDMLFDLVKYLDNVNEELKNELIEIHNTLVQPIILKKGD